MEKETWQSKGEKRCKGLEKHKSSLPEIFQFLVQFSICFDSKEQCYLYTSEI